MRVCITMERVQRIFYEVEVDDGHLAMLEHGDNPFCDEMLEDMDSGGGNVEYDYAVTDELGRDIVPWS